MKKYLIKSISAFVLIVLLSCDGVFIPDPIDPRLPKYTHQGNDAAGAFIDGRQWKSVVERDFMYTDNEPEFRSYSGDRLEISFYGDVGTESYNLKFILVGYGINTYEDLKKLEGRKILLDGDLNSGEVDTYGNSCYPGSGGTGQFYAKDISIRQNGSLVFSGTFGFVTADSACPSVEVTYGRFDYNVSDLDFRVVPE